jgi:hypothetical protein
MMLGGYDIPALHWPSSYRSIEAADNRTLPMDSLLAYGQERFRYIAGLCSLPDGVANPQCTAFWNSLTPGSFVPEMRK